MNHVYGVTLTTLQTIWPQIRNRHGRQATLTWTIEYPEADPEWCLTEPDLVREHGAALACPKIITGPAPERGRSHTRPHRIRQGTITMTDPTDLDETRRLLYMTLCAPLTKRYNLAGTLVNALIHHQGTLEERNDQGLLGQRSDLILKVCDAVDGRQVESTDWIWDYIDKLTAQLDTQP